VRAAQYWRLENLKSFDDFLGRRFPESRRKAYEGAGVSDEPSELVYFKVYKSQIPVIGQAIETAAQMLGTDKSRGYCLEMI
jgi:hypothetical protein